MGRWQRRFLGLGAAVCLLTTAAHLFGHFQEPQPRDADEATLFRLLDSVKTELGFGPRSLGDFLRGFSLSFCVLFLLSAAVALAAWRHAPHAPALARELSLVLAAAMAALLFLSVAYFFPPPAVCSGLALLCFALAAGGGHEART